MTTFRVGDHVRYRFAGAGAGEYLNGATGIILEITLNRTGHEVATVLRDDKRGTPGWYTTNLQLVDGPTHRGWRTP